MEEERSIEISAQNQEFSDVLKENPCSSVQNEEKHRKELDFLNLITEIQIQNEKINKIQEIYLEKSERGYNNCCEMRELENLKSLLSQENLKLQTLLSKAFFSGEEDDQQIDPEEPEGPEKQLENLKAQFDVSCQKQVQHNLSQNAVEDIYERLCLIMEQLKPDRLFDQQNNILSKICEGIVVDSSANKAKVATKADLNEEILQRDTLINCLRSEIQGIQRYIQKFLQEPKLPNDEKVIDEQVEDRQTEFYERYNILVNDVECMETSLDQMANQINILNNEWEQWEKRINKLITRSPPLKTPAFNPIHQQVPPTASQGYRLPRSYADVFNYLNI